MLYERQERGYLTPGQIAWLLAWLLALQLMARGDKRELKAVLSTLPANHADLVRRATKLAGPASDVRLRLGIPDPRVLRMRRGHGGGFGAVRRVQLPSRRRHRPPQRPTRGGRGIPGAAPGEFTEGNTDANDQERLLTAMLVGWAIRKRLTRPTLEAEYPEAVAAAREGRYATAELYAAWAELHPTRILKRKAQRFAQHYFEETDLPLRDYEALTAVTELRDTPKTYERLATRLDAHYLEWQRKQPRPARVLSLQRSESGASTGGARRRRHEPPRRARSGSLPRDLRRSVNRMSFGVRGRARVAGLRPSPYAPGVTMRDELDDFPRDPIIEEYKRHVDVTLLQENLKKTPDERVRAMIKMLELSEELRRGMRQNTAEAEQSTHEP